MRPAFVLAALVWAAAPATASAAETVHVGIPARAFTPPVVQAVAGDAVAWRNTSSEAHDVEGARVEPGGEVARTFPEPGIVDYVCVLHPSMTGRVEVVPVSLAGPPATPTQGEPLVLTGRAPAGTSFVTIERDGAPLATVAPGLDGAFRHDGVAESGTYRALTGGGASPPLRIDVLDRVVVGLSARLGRQLTTLSVTTLPARPGATVVLQLWSRFRFAWRRAATARLDLDGRTTLTLPRRVRRRARVVLLDAAGHQVAISRQAYTWRRKRVPAPPPPGPLPAPHGVHG